MNEGQAGARRGVSAAQVARTLWFFSVENGRGTVGRAFLNPAPIYVARLRSVQATGIPVCPLHCRPSSVAIPGPEEPAAMPAETLAAAAVMMLTPLAVDFCLSPVRPCHVLCVNMSETYLD